MKDVVCELLLLLSARVPVVIMAPVEFVLRDNTTENKKKDYRCVGEAFDDEAMFAFTDFVREGCEDIEIRNRRWQGGTPSRWLLLSR